MMQVMKQALHEDLKERLRELDMTQAEFSRIADVEYTTVNRWVLGKRPIPGLVWAYLDLRLKIRDLAISAEKASSTS